MTESITIVGASAAGLYLSQILASAGASVRVIERSTKRPVERTLIVTSAYRDLLGEVGEPAIRNHISTFELVAGPSEATVPLIRPDLIIERSQLLDDLARAAKEAGARIETGVRFTGITPDADGAEVSVAHRGGGTSTFRTRVLVAADGANSDVAAALGFRRPPLVPLLQHLIEMPASVGPDVSRVWFEPGACSYFVWLIPEGPTRAALGIIGDDGPAARATLDAYRDMLGVRSFATQGARIPAYARWIEPHRRLGGLDAYVIGDAAGHVKVSTVGGIVTGFRGARAAADQILDGDGARAWRSLRVELGAHLAVRKVLARFTAGDYEALLASLRPAVVRNLGGRNRDEPVRVLARALRARPALALLAARALVRAR